jgi:hypothetical protein
MKIPKTAGEKSVATGVSLPQDLITAAKAYAKAGGYGGLSGLTRHLITVCLAEAGQSAQDASDEAERKGKQEVKRGKEKMRRSNN